MVSRASGQPRRKVLVVEDNFLIAEVVREMLVDCGCDVVGPAPRVEQGLELVERTDLDGAILDINLGSENCFPIAAALSKRSVPFVFLTGYDDVAMIPPEFRDVTRLAKPVDQSHLAAATDRLFASRIA